MNSAAIRLTDQIMLVGSGEIGLSESHDCHVYLVDLGGQLVMIDSGAGIDPRAIVDNIALLGYELRQVTTLFLTHGHADHSGGAAYFNAQHPGVVSAGSRTALLVSQADEVATSLARAREEGIYPIDYRLQAVAPITSRSDGDRLVIGNSDVEVIAAPGHSADSMCFRILLQDGWALFCGDALSTDGRMPLLNTSDSNLADALASIARLASMSVTGLYPGHGVFRVRKGDEWIREFHGRMQQSIFLPPVLSG